MNKRLQVSIPEELDTLLSNAAQRSRVSKGEWVRRALQDALDRPSRVAELAGDPLARLAALGGPMAEIDELLAEIDAGRV